MLLPERLLNMDEPDVYNELELGSLRPELDGTSRSIETRRMNWVRFHEGTILTGEEEDSLINYFQEYVLGDPNHRRVSIVTGLGGTITHDFIILDNPNTGTNYLVSYRLNQGTGETRYDIAWAARVTDSHVLYGVKHFGENNGQIQVLTDFSDKIQSASDVTRSETDIIQPTDWQKTVLMQLLVTQNVPAPTTEHRGILQKDTVLSGLKTATVEPDQTETAFQLAQAGIARYAQEYAPTVPVWARYVRQESGRDSQYSVDKDAQDPLTEFFAPFYRTATKYDTGERRQVLDILKNLLADSECRTFFYKDQLTGSDIGVRFVVFDVPDLRLRMLVTLEDENRNNHRVSSAVRLTWLQDYLWGRDGWMGEMVFRTPGDGYPDGFRLWDFRDDKDHLSLTQLRDYLRSNWRHYFLFALERSRSHNESEWPSIPTVEGTQGLLPFDLVSALNLKAINTPATESLLIMAKHHLHATADYVKKPVMPIT